MVMGSRFESVSSLRRRVQTRRRVFVHVIGHFRFRLFAFCLQSFACVSLSVFHACLAKNRKREQARASDTHGVSGHRSGPSTGAAALTAPIRRCHQSFVSLIPHSFCAWKKAPWRLRQRGLLCPRTLRALRRSDGACAPFAFLCVKCFCIEVLAFLRTHVDMYLCCVSAVSLLCLCSAIMQLHAVLTRRVACKLQRRKS